MELHNLQVTAGFISSFIFVTSNFPMLLKAFRTRNLRSYSLAQIIMANVGNLLHCLYIAALPVGPIWFLHGFNTLVSIVMLGLYLQHETQLVRRFSLAGLLVKSDPKMSSFWPVK